MQLNELTLEELEDQTMERLVFGADEMSPILKGHIFIERILETLISKKMSNSNIFFKKRKTFDLKLDLAMAMGIIDQKHYSAFRSLNNIRNNYAHQDEYVVSMDELSGLKFDWADVQKTAFKAATTKGSGESAKISMIFLCWKAIELLQASNPQID